MRWTLAIYISTLSKYLYLGGHHPLRHRFRCGDESAALQASWPVWGGSEAGTIRLLWNYAPGIPQLFRPAR